MDEVTELRELIESYRCLVGEMIDSPSNPNYHEGTDQAIADFIASHDKSGEVLRSAVEKYMRSLPWSSTIS
jgi:hypothetical protein